jgi:hypothetical protein
MRAHLVLALILALSPSAVSSMPVSACSDISPTFPDVDSAIELHASHAEQRQRSGMRIPLRIGDVCRS